MIALVFFLLCIGGAVVAALWGLWQRITARPPRCERCSAAPPRRGAHGLCHACQLAIVAAVLPPSGPPAPGVVIAADEVPLPAWLVERVNEAGEHIARKRL